MNALPTDRQRDRPMDTVSYRGALLHLKNDADSVNFEDRKKKHVWMLYSLDRSILINSIADLSVGWSVRCLSALSPP